MGLQIYNTLAGNKEPFEPLAPPKVGIYVCGPTVYDYSHVGHARVYVAFDTIIRYLRRRYDVTSVRNFTDIDDKIIKRAAELGEDSTALSGRFIDAFYTDMDALGVARTDVEPKVTEHIPEIIEIIEQLVAKGIAYPAEGDVYFSVRKFPGYGKLGRRVLDDMEAGARVAIDDKKQDPMDFALWKKVKAGEPSWASPWGEGRPGWHIECSAMSNKYLGQTFDIHGGGKDLIFPHHENEIAQSEAAHDATFARYWMHNGFVNIDDEKMSKSLDNFFTVRDVLEKFSAQTIRFYLLTTHYRSPINFSDQALKETEARIKYIYETLQRLETAVAAADDASAEGAFRDAAVPNMVSKFEEAMDDDFNTAKAIGDLSDVFKLVNEIVDKPGASKADVATDARTLRAVHAHLQEIGAVLGLFCERPGEVLASIEQRKQASSGVDAARVEQLIVERTDARSSKNWDRADAIRKELGDMGVVIKDVDGQTSWELAG